ncbi:MAG: hypothetical protein KDN20_06635 [Verrucomicrobiae bacterium]|nr:hypothetical protein [Verrucomicrobiae bacterium]
MLFPNHSLRCFTITAVTALVFLHGAIGSHAAYSVAEFGPALKVEKVPGIDACQAVAVVGDRLYATGRGTFSVLDISRAADPKILGELSGLGNTRQIFVRDGIAYVSARQDGLWLIDLSDDAKPTIISHYDTVEMATGIWVSGSVAYIATRCYGVEIVDVSDPQKPRHLSTLKTGEAQSCWARDGFLYIGDWAPKKLLVADVRNPLEPKIVGEGLLDGYGDGGCLRGNTCFAATGHHSRALKEEDREGKGHGLEIFDVSDPTNPAKISGVKFPPSYHISNDMWTARVAGDHCVVADTWNGLFVVNIATLESPKIVAHAILPTPSGRDAPDPVGDIALGDGVIYAAGIFSGLYVVPAPGMAQPVVAEPDQALPIPPSTAISDEDADFLTYRPEGQVRSVSVVGDIAWAACGVAGIQAIRLGEDSLEPLSVTVPDEGEVFHVSVSGDRLYAAESAGGLGIYQIGPKLDLTEIGRLRLPGRNVKQVVCPPPGRFALLHCGSAQTLIADVSDPAKPEIVLQDSQVGLFYGDQLVPEMLGGKYLVAHWHRSGPAWYDVSGPKPTLFGNSPDERRYSWTDGACALGDRLLITKRGRLQLLEPGEMRDVGQLPSVGIEGNYLIGRPSTDGKRLALARRHEQQVQVLDITNWEKPVVTEDYHFSGHPGACGFWQDRLVVPAGYQGLLLEKPKP